MNPLTYLSQTFQGLSQEELSHIEKLVLRKCDIIDQSKLINNQICFVAPNIKNLRLSNLELLNKAQTNGTLDLNDFSNLEMLSIDFFPEDKNSIMDKEFLYKNLMELTKLKKLKKLYLDLSNQSTEHYITEELVKLIPFFQQLESFRIEIGGNDIRDIGFQNIANTISPLKNLKQLQIGVEFNSLGNYSFEILISVISGLDNLESLQVDFWDNHFDYKAYECMKQELEGKPVCKNIRKLRLSLQAYYHNEKESIKLFEGLALFINVQVFLLQLTLKCVDNDTGLAFNTFLMNNKNTLETVIIDFQIFNSLKLRKINDSIITMYQNINQINNLKNLLLQFYTNTTLESSQELLNVLVKCKQLSRLAIFTQSFEIRQGQIKDKIYYFKQFMEMNSVSEFEYSQCNYQLNSQWFTDFFEQDWKLKHFLDPHLISLSLQNSKGKHNYDEIKSKINEIQEIVICEQNESEQELTDNDKNYLEEENQENQNRKIEISQKIKSFEEYERQYDQEYRKQIILSYQDMQFSFKKIELLRAIVYQKYIKDIFNTMFSYSHQLTRNFWDLYY